jgi:hypothetical protein
MTDEGVTTSPRGAERPALLVSFRSLVAVLLGLALVALLGGRYVYVHFANYRPLALVHVPTTMRYRARVELRDAPRVEAIAPLLRALDPKGTRLPALEQKLGRSGKLVAREVAFGVGATPSEFVVVLGLQLQAQAGLPTARALCEVLSSDKIRSESTDVGCRLSDGALVAGTPDGSLVIASRADLVKGLLARPDIGDRMGFSGPSVRGASPEIDELSREAAALGPVLAAKYP